MTIFRSVSFRWPRHLGAALLGAWLMSACQAQPVQQPGPAAEAAMAQRITAEIGTAACTRDADCRTLPMGSKPCGGPARWVAWSATVSRGDALQAMATDLAALQQQRQAAEGMMSTCSVVPDPGARCDAGRCVLNRPAAQR
jgi:hypothetical protein